MNNPILFDFNRPVLFAQITEAHIAEAEKYTLAQLTNMLEDIYNIPQGAHSKENTLWAYDAIYSKLSSISALTFLMMSVSPQAAIREQAMQSVEALEKFGNALAVDEQLYKAFRTFAQSPEAARLHGTDAKMLSDVLRNFERSGFGLSKEKRDQLKLLQDRQTELSNLFYQNIAAHKDELLTDEAGMAGLPEPYKQAHRQPDGSYRIGLDYPSYQPFMQYAHAESLRKELYLKFMNRAADKNLDILNELLQVRHRIAALLGYATYAHYVQEVLMAKTPDVVWQFEQDLSEKVRDKARADYQELLSVKQTHTGNTAISQLHSWETGYYKTILLKEKYSVDPEEIRQYFSLDNVLQGLFLISERLFGVRFEKQEGASVWHRDVSYYRVTERGNTIGHLYLDLFPRENKYGHAACFPLIQGRQTTEGYQHPVLALVCNFTKPGTQQPSLLRHGEVETMFHEFGHALHVLLTQSPLSVYAGTNTARDFVEVPSQLLENWAWHYDSLKLFAKHYQTGQVLPHELFDKMLAAKNLGSGLHVQQQILYGSYDLTLHGSYQPGGEESTTDVIRRLQNQLTLFPYVEGTHFEAAFGHLTGYAASYYSYLWSLVYAEDIFEVFAKKGIMDTTLGKKYREAILAKGGSEDEMQQLETFLERAPRPDAFIRSLGL